MLQCGWMLLLVVITLAAPLPLAPWSVSPDGKSCVMIDDALADPAQDPAPDPLSVAELSSQRKDLEYQLKDHGDKIDRRSHGLHLSRMRRKHR